jgi:hypothetical protein
MTVVPRRFGREGKPRGQQFNDKSMNCRDEH